MRFNLPAHRRRANQRMKATVIIRRPDAVATDPDTGAVNTDGQIVYQGRARWKAPTTVSTESEVGTAVLVTTPGAVHIPIVNPDGYSPQPGDVIECTADPAQPSLVGQKVAVRSRFDGDDLTAYRIPIEGT